MVAEKRLLGKPRDLETKTERREDSAKRVQLRGVKMNLLSALNVAFAMIEIKLFINMSV